MATTQPALRAKSTGRGRRVVGSYRTHTGARRRLVTASGPAGLSIVDELVDGSDRRPVETALATQGEVDAFVADYLDQAAAYGKPMMPPPRT